MNSLSVGDVIAGYRLDELVGRGGMGVVFRATHIALERQVAVKLIAPELAEDEKFRQRFQRESRLAASIDHPHVIPIFDAGDEDGQLYVAMRYVDGTDLAAFIAREGQPGAATGGAGDRLRSPTLSTRRTSADLCTATSSPPTSCSRARPAGYHTYLTDFGLVKTVGAASGVLTRTGQWLGTPDYAAPEQIMGGEVGCPNGRIRARLHALPDDRRQAALRGRDRRGEDVRSPLEPPPSLSDEKPDVPAALDDVIRTALAKEPAERQPSASELALAAREAIEVPAPTAAAPQAATTAAPVAETSSRPRRPPARRASRPRQASNRPRQPPAGRPRRRGWSRPRLWYWWPPASSPWSRAAEATAGRPAEDGEATGRGCHPGREPDQQPLVRAQHLRLGRLQSDIAREQASDAPDGENVARVSLWAGGRVLDRRLPRDRELVAQGCLYTASAWVKATEATDGRTICISLREGLRKTMRFPSRARR